MENAGTFILIVTLAASILQIILFFRLWEMANNVDLLRKTHAYSSNVDFEIRKLIALGNKEKAKDFLINWFLESIGDERYNFEKGKKKLEDCFKKLGEELPDNIKNLQSYNDFCRLF